MCVRAVVSAVASVPEAVVCIPAPASRAARVSAQRAACAACAGLWLARRIECPGARRQRAANLSLAPNPASALGLPLSLVWEPSRWSSVPAQEGCEQRGVCVCGGVHCLGSGARSSAALWKSIELSRSAPCASMKYRIKGSV